MHFAFNTFERRTQTHTRTHTHTATQQPHPPSSHTFVFLPCYTTVCAWEIFVGVRVWPNGVFFSCACWVRGRARVKCFRRVRVPLPPRRAIFHKVVQFDSNHRNKPGCTCLGCSWKCSVSRIVLACSPSATPDMRKSRRMVKWRELRTLKHDSRFVISTSLVFDFVAQTKLIDFQCVLCGCRYASDRVVKTSIPG